jgi:hypothetical protein
LRKFGLIVAGSVRSEIHALAERAAGFDTSGAFRALKLLLTDSVRRGSSISLFTGDNLPFSLDPAFPFHEAAIL